MEKYSYGEHRSQQRNPAGTFQIADHEDKAKLEENGACVSQVQPPLISVGYVCNASTGNRAKVREFKSERILDFRPRLQIVSLDYTKMPVTHQQTAGFSHLKTWDEKLRVLNSLARICGGDLPGTIKNAG